MRKSLFPALITLTVGYTCFENGGVTSPEWGYSMLALCALSLALWLPGPFNGFAPLPHPALLTALILVPVAVATQLIPLPYAWLQTIDPARAELLRGLHGLDPAAAAAWAPLSVAPAITFAHLERVLSYLLMFFMARELSWRMRSRRWWLAVPVIVVGTLEAALGIAQYFAGAGRARGTWVNPNHFAALLHMAFPLAVMLAATLIRRRPGEPRDSVPRVAIGCVLLAAAATMLIGAFDSLSRMGLATVLTSGIVMAGLGFTSRLRGSARVLGAVVPVAILLFVMAAAPGPLVDRFYGANGEAEVTSDVRLQFWKETGNLMAAYPVFGCGLGTYASAIQKFRNSAPLGLLEFAHNDYLQTAAELGAVGWAPWLVSGVWLLVTPWRAAFASLRSKNRLLAVACAASLSAIALDSTVDFDFYVPANMLVAAWIAGIASGLWFKGAEGTLSGQEARLR
jgi:O-antigen ligase